jgi:hypothetical protein
MEQTIAAADASVAIALTDRMIGILVGGDSTLFEDLRPIMARFFFDEKCR